MIVNIYKGTTLSHLVYRLKVKRLGPVLFLWIIKLCFLFASVIVVGATAITNFLLFASANILLSIIVLKLF